jgi:hypothetical protein
MKVVCNVLLLACVALLFGCAGGAKMENMVYSDLVNGPKAYDPSLNNGVQLQGVSGGQKTNPAWTSEIGDEEFSGAVKESLRLQSLLAEGDAGKYQLEVKLLEVDQPMFGLNFKVTMHAQYILKEAATGRVLLDKTLVTDYTAGVGDAFAAVKRLRLANEGSAKTNIGALLTELSTLKISPKNVSMAK